MTLIEQARIIVADMWYLAGPNRKAVLKGEWDDIRQVQCALLALETQAAEIARLRGLLGEVEAGLEEAKGGIKALDILIAALSGGRPSVMAETFAERVERTLAKLRAEGRSDE